MPRRESRTALHRPTIVAAALTAVLVLAPALTGCASAPSPTQAETQTSAPTPVAFGDLPTSELDPALESKLQAVLDESVQSGNPDVIAAVVTADGRWSGAAGVDGPDGRLAAASDEFAIASITKAFTATLIMRLVDDGKIDLDQPLSTYLGDLDVDANGATVRQALQMMSGIPDTSDQSLANLSADPSHVWTTEEIIAEFPSATDDPGSTYLYSNPTYKLLGFAAEYVTGLSFADAMRTLVLDPAGSPESLRVQTPDSPLPQPWALPVSGTNAPPDSFGNGSALPNIADASFSVAGAGMAGTAPSVADWAWQLFAGRVVSAASLQSMMTTTSTDGSGSGLDELVGQNPGGAFGHTGNKDGYQSLLAVFPDSQTVIVVFINRRDAPVDAVVASLNEALTE